jgi:hypothetical protein
MNLHRRFCDTDIVGNLLAEAALHDVDHYLAFPRGKRFEARSERTQSLFILALSTITSKGELDRVDQVLITERLGQELNGTAFHRLHRHRDVTVPRYEDNWDWDTRLREFALKIQAARPGQSNVKNEAGGTDRAFRFEEVGNGDKEPCIQADRSQKPPNGAPKATPKNYRFKVASWVRWCSSIRDEMCHP